MNIVGGSFNTGLGYQSMSSITSGIQNTGCGYGSLYSLTSGNYNVGCGIQALPDNVSGSFNSALGYMSGMGGMGSDNTYLGSFSGNDGVSVWGNSTAIGAGALITGNNQIVVGRASEKVVILGNVSVGKSGNGFNMDINGNVNFSGNLYQNGSLYTQAMPTDISCNNLTTASGNIYIGTSQLFRYKPWTSIGTTNAVITALIPNATPGGGTTGTNPTFNSGNTVKYHYSVIGNTMYMEFSFYSTGTGGTQGNGKYLYNIPSGYIPNASVCVPYQLSSSQASPTGTVIGQANLSHIGNFLIMGQVWIVQNASYGIGIGTTSNILTGNDHCSYAGTGNIMSFTFSCSFPIN
jgi:hypothetical protein